MKSKVLYLSLLTLSFSFFFSCNKLTEKPILIPEYIVSVEATTNINAPALQSFTHGISGSEWLLFAGRTNQSEDNGGLHDMRKNSDYSDESFPPTSFNENISVYNPNTDAVPTSITIAQLLDVVSRKFTSYNLDTIKKYTTVFKNTNALVKQVDDYLYVVGGYGPIDFTNPKNGYETYNQIARIHVPSMIELVKGNYASVNETKLFAFAQNKNLISTGGELHYINGTFYLVGGHNFGKNAPNQGQKYVDAVYPFAVSTSAENPYVLSFLNGNPISDVADPKAISSDTLSAFRRRDGPITTSLYYNPVNNKIEESIAIYAGVFKPGEKVLAAWNDAIYVHPNWTTNNKQYTYDKTYNQKNFNVYSCPSVVAFDTNSKVLHTFLLGGIGDGNTKKEIRLSGFTNTGTHIKLNIDGSPLKSSRTTFSKNLFANNTTNEAPFYGAEALFFPSKDLKTISESKDVIDVNSTFTGDTKNANIGYVFGGIESFSSYPGTYGRTKSRASNKVWKIVLTKQTIN